MTKTGAFQRGNDAGRSRRWLLRGAAVGVAAVGGIAATRATPASASTLPTGWLNVTDYGAVGDGTTDNTTAFSQALSDAASSNGATVFVPTGNYKVNGQLEMTTGVTLLGASRYSTIITQAATTGALLHALDKSYMSVSNLTLQGPGQGTGTGIYFDHSTAALSGLDIRDVNIYNFGGDHLYLSTAITSTITNVRCMLWGANTVTTGTAFHTYSGTSLTFTSCYANGPFQVGYRLDGLHYASLISCAADTNVQAYYLYNTQSVTLTGCGCENASSNGYVVNAGLSASLNGCRNLGNSTVGFLVTNSARHVTLTSCDENSPKGSPTASFQVDAGSTAVATNLGWTTRTIFAAGTTYAIQSTGSTVY